MELRCCIRNWNEPSSCRRSVTCLLLWARFNHPHRQSEPIGHFKLIHGLSTGIIFPRKTNFQLSDEKIGEEQKVMQTWTDPKDPPDLLLAKLDEFSRITGARTGTRKSRSTHNVTTLDSGALSTAHSANSARLGTVARDHGVEI